MNLDNITQKFQNNLSKDEKVFIDPMTMMLIATLMSSLFTAFKECKKEPEEAVEVAHHPSARDKRVLKRKLRRELGLKKYWQEGDVYYEAALATGKELTHEDFREAYGQSTTEYRV